MNDITMNHRHHTAPTLEPITVTGAAKRSVDAADAAGMAAHNAVTEVQMRMLAHHKSRIDNGIDATWCAQALRLINEHKCAEDRIANLKTRWKRDATCAVYCVGSGINADRICLLDTWPNDIDRYAKKLEWAGVPPIKATRVPESWDDAAMRGC